METRFCSEGHKLGAPIWHYLCEANDKRSAIHINLLAHHVRLHGRLALTIIFPFPSPASHYPKSFCLGVSDFASE